MKNIVIACVLFLLFSCQNSFNKIIPGKWCYEVDLDEYSGLYVHDFTESGDIILIDYPNNIKFDTNLKTAIYKKSHAGKYVVKNNFLYINLDEKTFKFKIDKKNKKLVGEGRSIQLIAPRDAIKHITGSE